LNSDSSGDRSPASNPANVIVAPADEDGQLDDDDDEVVVVVAVVRVGAIIMGLIVRRIWPASPPKSEPYQSSSFGKRIVLFSTSTFTSITYMHVCMYESTYINKIVSVCIYVTILDLPRDIRPPRKKGPLQDSLAITPEQDCMCINV
jgi:hypothetical protein